MSIERRLPNLPRPLIRLLTYRCLIALSAFAIASHSQSQDLSQYRTAGPDRRAANVSSEVLRDLARSPARALPVLVKTLVGNVQDPLQKTKVLHDWVALNIDYDVSMWMSGRVRNQSYQDVLRTRKGVCEGYGGLFREMCRLAGIECRLIPGHARGTGYDPFEPESMDDENHAWNAVRIDGVWRLIDVTWDAGHVEGEAFSKEYSSEYLFADPHAFIYTHFPSDPTWQLLGRPASAQQFSDLPDLSGEYFAWCGTPPEEWKRIFQSENGRANILLPVKPEAVITAQLIEFSKSKLSGNRFQITERTLPGNAFVQGEGNGTDQILLAFPHKGRYLIRLFVKRKGDQGAFHSIGALGVESLAGSTHEFPEQFAGFRENGYQLISPLETMVHKGKDVAFAVVLPGIERTLLTCGKVEVELKETSHGKFEGAIAPATGDDVILWIATDKGAMKLSAILRFPVVTGE